MAEDLDSRKRRASGFRSRQSSGPTGPGGSTRPGGARPSRGPGGTTRPSSGASVGGSAARLPVRGGGASSTPQAAQPSSAAPSADQAERFKQLENEAAAAHANAPTHEDDRAMVGQGAQKLGNEAAAGKASADQATRDYVKEANEALKSAPNGNRPLTAADRANTASDEERNAAGNANPDRAQSALSAIGSNFKRHRTGLIAGGGIVGLFIALVLGFLALLPLKLESLMKNIIENRIENRADHYVERRADRMLARYLLSSVGTGDAEFERSIVATGRPLLDAYRTLRLNHFEDKLEAHQGLRFQRVASGGGVDAYKDGTLLGNITDSEARVAIRLAARNETKWFQFILRRHLRQWMRNAYGVSKWSFFKKLFNNKADPTATDDEMANNAIDSAATPLATETANTMSCALGAIGAGPAPCQTDANNPDAADRVGELDTDPSRTNNANDSDIDNAVSDGDQTAADKAKQYLHNIATKVGSGDVKTDKLFGRILTKFLGEEITKDIITIVEAAKGPLIIISLVDISSRIDHFLYNGGADKMLVAAHEVEYANQFAEWQTIEDNFKDGTTVTGDEVNSTQKMLDGVEKSQAFQNTYLHNESGQSLTTTSDGNGGTTDNTTARSIDEHSHPIEDFYRRVFGDTPTPFEPGATWHDFFRIWFDTGGKIWGLINQGLGDITSFLLHILEIFFPILKTGLSWLTSNIEGWIVKLVLWLSGAAVDGTERGPDLANGIDAGATVTGVGFARDLGAPEINPVAAAQLDNTIAKENQAAANQLSLADRLFSTDYNHSLVNTLAVAVPVSPDDAVNDSLDYFASLTQNPFRSFAPLLRYLGIGQAQAATTNGADAMYGMYDWAYTDAQLDGDDTAELNQAWQNAATRTGKLVAPVDMVKPDPTKYVVLNDLEVSDCPPVADETKDPNLCRLDIPTLQSLTANSTTDDNGGLNSGGGGTQ